MILKVLLFLLIILGSSAIYAQSSIIYAQSVYAGTGTAISTDNANPLQASFNGPGMMTMDSSGNLFVFDNGGYKIRRIAAGGGTVTTYAGNGVADSIASARALTASFVLSGGLCFNQSGDLFTDDSATHYIRKIAPNGSVGGNASLFAGDGTAGFLDQPGAPFMNPLFPLGNSAQFNNPKGNVADAQDNIYIADASNNRIRKITDIALPSGEGHRVFTFAGDGTGANTDNNNPLAAQFVNLQDIEFDPQGNMIVAQSNRLRKIIVNAGTAGAVTTIAGTGAVGQVDNNNPLLATFNGITAITVSGDGTIFMADAPGIRMMGANGGAVTTIPIQGVTDPTGIAIDGSGRIYFSSPNGGRIYRLTPVPNLTSLVGVGDNGSFGSEFTNALVGFISSGGSSTTLLQIANNISRLSGDDQTTALQQLAPTQVDGLNAALDIQDSDIHQLISARISGMTTQSTIKKDHVFDPSQRFQSQFASSMSQNQFDSEDFKDPIMALSRKKSKRDAFQELENMGVRQKKRGGGLWVQPYFSPTSLGTASSSIGFKSRAGGFLIGADKLFNNHKILAGLSLGISAGDITWRQSYGKARVRSVQLVPYLSYHKGKGLVESHLILGYNRLRNSRHIRVADITAHGKTEGFILSPYIGGKYKIPLHVKGLSVNPLMGISYTITKLNEFKEKDAGDLSLNVQSVTAEYVRIRTGLELDYHITRRKVESQLKLYMGYIWRKTLKSPKSVFNIGPLQTDFTLTPQRRRLNLVGLGINYEILMKKDVTLAFRYDGEIGRKYTGHEFSLRLSKRM